MTPYVCENTIVRLRNGKEGHVITVNPRAKVAIIKSDRTFHTERTYNLSVVSYKEVE